MFQNLILLIQGISIFIAIILGCILTFILSFALSTITFESIKFLCKFIFSKIVSWKTW